MAGGEGVSDDIKDEARATGPSRVEAEIAAGADQRDIPT